MRLLLGEGPLGGSPLIVRGELGDGGIIIVEVSYLHRLEGLQQAARDGCVLAPSLEPGHDLPLLGDEREAQRDAPLGFRKTLFQQPPIHGAMMPRRA